MLDSGKLNKIADAIDKISSRFDAMLSRKDEWSPEARKAAAEARKGGGGNDYEKAKEAMGRAIDVHNEMISKFKEGKIDKKEMEHHHGVFHSMQSGYEKARRAAGK